MPPWILCNENGKLLDPSRVRKVFQRALNGAGLPLHFHPHCLRHTFATLMLQQGESPVYVQQQLGNSSIKLTVDTYGKWLPMGNKQAVDKLDSGIGTKMVAETGSGTPDPWKCPI
jgi:integrase